MDIFNDDDVPEALLDLSNGHSSSASASVDDFAPMLRRVDQDGVTTQEGMALMSALRETCRRTGRFDYWRYVLSKPRCRIWWRKNVLRTALKPFHDALEARSQIETIVRIVDEIIIIKSNTDITPSMISTALLTMAITHERFDVIDHVIGIVRENKHGLDYVIILREIVESASSAETFHVLMHKFPAFERISLGLLRCFEMVTESFVNRDERRSPNVELLATYTRRVQMELMRRRREADTARRQEAQSAISPTVGEEFRKEIQELRETSAAALKKVAEKERQRTLSEVSEISASKRQRDADSNDTSPVKRARVNKKSYYYDEAYRLSDEDLQRLQRRRYEMDAAAQKAGMKNIHAAFVEEAFEALPAAYLNDRRTYMTYQDANHLLNTIMVTNGYEPVHRSSIITSALRTVFGERVLSKAIYAVREDRRLTERVRAGKK